MRRSIRRQGRRGSALVEFALAFVFLLPLFYGALKFGLAFFYYNELASAVRAGARYASYRTYDSATETPSQYYRDGVQNMTKCGDPHLCDTAVVPGLEKHNVWVKVTMVGGKPAFVTVSITSFTLDVVFTKITLSRPSARFPYLGVYAPAT